MWQYKVILNPPANGELWSELVIRAGLTGRHEIMNDMKNGGGGSDVV